LPIPIKISRHGKLNAKGGWRICTRITTEAGQKRMAREGTEVMPHSEVPFYVLYKYPLKNGFRYNFATF
jgi:hypothetical protein